MNHYPYRNWILNHPELTKEQQQELLDHFRICTNCQNLQLAWQESEKILKSAILVSPLAGFPERWAASAKKRMERENTRQTRRTLFGVFTLMAAGTTLYIVQNNLLVTWLVTALNLVASLIIILSKGITGISELFYKEPTAAIYLGVLFFGAATAFLSAFVFALWNLLTKEKVMHEHSVQD